MKPTYRIKDWYVHFENNRTRALKDLRFVILPNKQDGDGYTELVDHPNGAAHFGAWCALVQVASKCKPRGTLVREVHESAQAHDPKSLARVTRLPADVFQEAMPRLVQIGWLEELNQSEQLELGLDGPGRQAQDETPPPDVAVEQGNVTIRQEGAGKCAAYRTEGNGIELKGKEEIPTARKKSARRSKSLIPEDFKPDEKTKTWADQHAPAVDLNAAVGEFVDYWIGEGELKSDWNATLRNRLRVLQERSGQRTGNGSNQKNTQRRGSAGSDFVFKPRSFIN